MMIYTNNSGPREWANHILSYFEKKINYKLIDQIIAAFKINGKRVEICRTTHNKTHNDLIKCTKIPIETEICFMDDNFYPDMANEKIYYINIKPYYHDLDFKVMIERIFNSDIFKNKIEDKDEFFELLMKNISGYKYKVIQKDEKEYEIDNILGKHIINHLQNFFNQSSKSKTIKNRGTKKNKTQRFYK